MHRGSLRPVLLWSVVLLVIGAGTAVRARPSPAHALQFRTGTDVVAVDVTVLGRDGAPVTTLRADDFMLTVDAKPRRLQAVRLLKSETGNVASFRQPEPKAGDAGGVTRAAVEPRRFVIVIDREHIPAGEGQQMLNAAAAFLDSLPSEDRVAVWTSTQNSETLRFSEDRAAAKERIRGSVGTFRVPFGRKNITLDEALTVEQNPDLLETLIQRECKGELLDTPGRGSCPKAVESQARDLARDARDRADQMLARTAGLMDALAALDGPKHIVLITGGPLMANASVTTVNGMVAQAARARVTVHAIQVPPGDHRARTDQMVTTYDDIGQERPGDAHTMSTASIALATATGGLAITPATGEIGFKRLTRELSAAYVLVFETEDVDRDGKVHRIDVHVRGRGWGSVVRWRQSFAVRPGEAAATAEAAPTGAAASAAPATPVIPAEPVGTDPGDMAERLAGYVESFERTLSAVVVEERFVQVIVPWRGTPSEPEKERALVWLEPGEKGPKTGPVVSRRQLLSDVLLVQSGKQWQSYRDVAEVDGRAVRDRTERVQRLFLAGGSERTRGFQEIAAESARYNLGEIRRDLNLPTVSLALLRRENHHRFEFKRQKDESLDGRLCRVLAYRERKTPTLLSTRNSGDIFLYGRVWLDQADGRVRRTELRFDRPVVTRDGGGLSRTIHDGTRVDVGSGSGMSANRSCVRVDYGTVADIGTLVPVRMWEWHEGVNQLGRIGGDVTGVLGLATYSKYRRFQVTTTETVK